MVGYFGNTTASITWITPLVPLRSVMVTWAEPPFSSVSFTLPLSSEAVRIPPLTVFKIALPFPFLIASSTAAASRLPATT